MGNTDSTMESSLDSPLSRNNSQQSKARRKYSSSPPRRSGSLKATSYIHRGSDTVCDTECHLSLRRHNDTTSTLTTNTTNTSIRRSKTCRIKDRTSARRAVCAVTGLTLHQKALLTRKWNRMHKQTIHELGRRVFEGIFEETPLALAYIGLSDEQNWRESISFKMHVQRFVCALNECMKRMREPTTACDILRDFGAGYVQEHEKKRVPATFFEKLANALNESARQLQESDHLTVERARSHSADDPSESSSEGGTTGPGVSRGTDSMTTTSSTTVLSDQFRPSICSAMTNNNSSPSFLIPTDTSCFDGLSRNCSADGVCPITSEAWLMFAVFVANQIKFGYELERVLQGEMSKLGLSTGTRKSFIDQPQRPEIALFNQ